MSGRRGAVAEISYPSIQKIQVYVRSDGKIIVFHMIKNLSDPKLRDIRTTERSSNLREIIKYMFNHIRWHDTAFKGSYRGGS